MQVFTPYPQPFACADCLDPRRLNKQIIECKQILAAIRGESQAWKNRPVVKQYADYTDYLKLYTLCLPHYKAGNHDIAMSYSDKAMILSLIFLQMNFVTSISAGFILKTINSMLISISMAKVKKIGIM